MPNLEKVYQKIMSKRNVGDTSSTSPAYLFITLIYLVCVLSVSLYEPQKLIWLAAYPIILSEMEGIGYGRLFLKSLWIIPIVCLIGLFNPIVDTYPLFKIGIITISRGWISFISIILRGLLSFQAILILIETTGFLDIINTVRKFGCPSVLTTQLLLTYRYISVIIEEAIIMKRARSARGYGKKNYPFSMWGIFIGQLLIRSAQKAEWIHKAMLARGFSGYLPTGRRITWTNKEWIKLICWTAIILCLRFINFSNIFKHFPV